MLWLLVVLVVLGLLIHAVLDCTRSADRDVQWLPRPVWLLVIVMLPLIGPLAWMVFGRPQPGRHHRGRGGDGPGADAGDQLRDLLREHPRGQLDLDEPPFPAPGPRVVGPDDDPDFIAELGRRRQDELRRQQGREGLE